MFETNLFVRIYILLWLRMRWSKNGFFFFWKPGKFSRKFQRYFERLQLKYVTEYFSLNNRYSFSQGTFKETISHIYLVLEKSTFISFKYIYSKAISNISKKLKCFSFQLVTYIYSFSFYHFCETNNEIFLSYDFLNSFMLNCFQNDLLFFFSF